MLRLAYSILTSAALIALGGCNIVGPVAAVAAGPPKVDAAYSLEDRPTLVFIDDRNNVMNPTTYRRVVADKVSEDLMTRKLVTRTISPHDAMSLASRYDTNREVMPIDAIGRAVGAEQVVYIQMLAFQDAQPGGVPRGSATAGVRVIDAENRKRLFPPEESEQRYHIVSVMTREFDLDLYRSRASRHQVYQAISLELGDRIAKTFYRHESRELGGSLSPR